jgi:predicted nucleic acid-binding protein
VRYLLDTTWAADYLRARRPVVTAIKEREPEGLAISVVTLAELFSGIEEARDRTSAERGLAEFLSRVRVLGVDEQVCRIWGREDTRLSRAGTPIGDIDLFIVATALAHDLTLCTQNRKHFERIPSLQIVSL